MTAEEAFEKGLLYEIVSKEVKGQIVTTTRKVVNKNTVITARDCPFYFAVKRGGDFIPLK